MKKALASALIVVAAVVLVSGQSKPDFSGTWITVEPKEMAGEEQKVTHTATELILEHESGGGGHRIVHKLDGSATENTVGHAKSVSRATWEGETLVITTSAVYEHGGKRETRQAWSMGGDGRLTVEMTETGPDGKPAKIKAVSRKK